MSGYNPYRTQIQSQNNILSSFQAPTQTNFFGGALARMSKFGRNYGESVLKNAKGIHTNEDLSMVTDSSGLSYSLFSRKSNAAMEEQTKIAMLSGEYAMKLNIFREYADKGEIREYISKMANEIIIYSKDKKFCELLDLPDKYSKEIKNSAHQIFEKIYNFGNYNNGTLAWDLCRDWLVEGYICKEIVYDNKRKNIIGFQTLAPESLLPIVDPETGIKLWIQYPGDTENQRIFLDTEIIYISYAGSSNYMETSYIEPLIRPYNELKSIERSKLLFNLINATMHKEFIIPTHGLPPHLAEQEIATLIADYKDHITFDDSTGLTYIDGSKDLPYSKEYWFPSNGEGKPEMNIIEPGGHDLNENSMLTWFKNSLKQASKFPITRLDNSIGGGNIYSTGNDITHDDYNFTQYVERLRSLFKELLIKPIYIQLVLNYPELEKDDNLMNELDLDYYGYSEIIKAKELSNLQAKVSIANDLQTNFKRGDDVPYFHWDYIAKEILELTDEQIALNNKYWANSKGEASTADGGGSDDFGGGSDDFGGGSDDFGGGSDDFDGGSDDFDSGSDDFGDDEIEPESDTLDEE